MPYISSEETDGKSSDRKIIDAALEPLARKIAAEITNNFSLRKIYQRVFIETARALYHLIHLLNSEEIYNAFQLDPASIKLAKTIYRVGTREYYGGAYLGAFNYAITRFIQRVPQIKVEQGEWKYEFRYWLYAETVSALVYASRHTEDLDIGVDGVFIDIKNEYKWRVNRSYETAQILKNGDCYDTPYYNKLVEVVDENGNHIGHVYVDVERSKETLNLDRLDFQLVLKKKS